MNPYNQGQGWNNQYSGQGNEQGFNQNQNFYPQQQGQYQQQNYNNDFYNNNNNNYFYNNQGGQGFNNFGGMGSNNRVFGGFQIPDEFIIKEKLLTIGMDMKLQRNGSQFGFIKQKMFSIGRKFQLQDSNGRLVAEAKEKVLTIGRDFQIFDGNGAKIGSIIEQVLKSMLSFHRKYTIRDASGNAVGGTKQLTVGSWGTMQIIGSTGSPQARFQQKVFQFVRDAWEVKFFGSNIDRRLLIFFPSISSQRQEQKINMNTNIN